MPEKAPGCATIQWWKVEVVYLFALNVILVVITEKEIILNLANVPFL